MGIRQLQDGTFKKDLHRPRVSAIIPNLTAAGSHPDCRAVLIQIVALHFNDIGGLDSRMRVAPDRHSRFYFRLHE